MNALAKIDTGADFCVFKRDYADILELRAEDGLPMRLSTAGGPLDTHGHLVQLSCLGYAHEAMVYFAANNGLPRNVLGLQGWLDKFRFALVHYDRVFYLSRYDQ